MNTKFFIAYYDGTVEQRNVSSLKVEGKVKLEAGACALISDDKLVYAGLENGKIVYFPIGDLQNYQILQERNPSNPMTMFKLSRDQTFLVGYCDIDNREVFNVYNTVKKELAWSGKLDLAGGDIREDPEKLLEISDDCLNLFARGENNKGVTMYSLYDGSIITNMTAMHTNYIF